MPSPNRALALNITYTEPASTTYEDIWNWSEFAYVQLGITAPRAGTVTMVVDYKEVAVTDPCYTCFDYRYGIEGGFSYTTTDHQLTWDFDVDVGANTVLIDLCLPNEGVVPVAAARMQHVEDVTFRLPTNTGDDPETWNLTGFNLVLDPGDDTRAAPETHTAARFKRSWDWLNEDAFDGDWFGFGAVVDGKDCLEVDYGYEVPFGFSDHERKLLYLQRMEHCPTYTGPDTRLDYAKSIARLVLELGWQEGWTTTENDPASTSQNQDADTNRLKAAFN